MSKNMIKVILVLAVAGIIFLSAAASFADMLYLRSGHDVIMQSVVQNGDVYDLIDCDGEQRSVDMDFVRMIDPDIGCDYKTDSQGEHLNEYRYIEFWAR